MLSFSQGQQLFKDLTKNQSGANGVLYGQLANIEHRYLLQKYFSNEGSFQTTTVGSQNITATGAISLGATSATLTSPWPYQTTTAQVTFSDGEYRTVNFTGGSTAITWSGALTAGVTSALAVGGVQFYPLPPNYSKLKDVTITIGNLQWTPTEIFSREEWDRINVFPYYADIPKNFFIYPGGDHNGQIGIWPIPSTTGNVITFNYKFRVPDLSIADYTTPGTVTVTKNGTTVTGSATTFQVTANQANESRWIQFAPTATTATSGDNLWYQIVNISTNTALSLYGPYQGNTVTASGNFIIGQMPLLAEDFQDMLLWRALSQYYMSIVKDENRVTEYNNLYNDKLKLLAEYSGSNTVQVNLSRKAQVRNPNNFPYSLQG